MSSADSRMERAVEDGLGGPLRTVYELTENQQTVEWSDVSENMSSGEWGRLIQKGVITEVDDGMYELRDREATQNAIQTTSSVADFDLDSLELDADWTRGDKLAAGLAGVWITAYTFEPLRNLINTVLDPILGTLSQIVPMFAVIFILGGLTGVWSLYIRSRRIDMEAMEQFREKLQQLQPDREDMADGNQGSSPAQSELMSKQLDMMKAQFRPMGWISAATFPAFIWLYSTLVFAEGSYGTVILPLLGQVPWTMGVVGPLQAWILWYALCSISTSQIIDKLVGITPN